MNMSRCVFYDLLRVWAKKYNVSKEAEKFIRQEIKYEKRLNKVLTKRLRNINGTTEVKNVLFKILKLQRNMHLPLIEIENDINKLMAALPEGTKHEVTALWNMLCPDDIHGPCMSSF
ncbi:hypothetical protein ACH3XW_28650 [Acanthocheilonema viteae]